MSLKASERPNSRAPGAATRPKTLPRTSLIMEAEPRGTDFDWWLSHAQWLHGGVVDNERGCPHASPLPSPTRTPCPVPPQPVAARLGCGHWLPVQSQEFIPPWE